MILIQTEVNKKHTLPLFDLYCKFLTKDQILLESQRAY